MLCGPASFYCCFPRNCQRQCFDEGLGSVLHLTDVQEDHRDRRLDLSSRISPPYLPAGNPCSGDSSHCCAPAPGVGWKRVALPSPASFVQLLLKPWVWEKTAEHHNKASKDRTGTTHLVLIYFHLADPGFKHYQFLNWLTRQVPSPVCPSRLLSHQRLIMEMRCVVPNSSYAVHADSSFRVRLIWASLSK